MECRNREKETEKASVRVNGVDHGQRHGAGLRQGPVDRTPCLLGKERGWGICQRVPIPHWWKVQDAAVDNFPRPPGPAAHRPSRLPGRRKAEVERVLEVEPPWS